MELMVPILLGTADRPAGFPIPWIPKYLRQGRVVPEPMAAASGNLLRGGQWLRVAFGLLVLILLIAFSGLAVAEEASTPNPEAAGEAVELPGKRTATSNTFELADGTLETQLFQTPVNYRDEDGDWQPIEQELQEAASGAVTNGDNSFDVYLPEDLDQAPIRVSVDDTWVSEAPIGLDTEPAELQADGTASYADDGAAASLDYVGLANGLKETINLRDSSAPASYHFKLEASAGVTPTLLEDGSVEFRDGDEEVVAEMPPPMMIDDVEAAAPEGAVHYSLKADGPQRWQITVEADTQWLADPDRVWPVSIDPSLTVPMPELDCVLISVDQLSRCGSSGFSYLLDKANYPSSGPDEYGRSLLRFSLASIPKTAALTSATVGLYSAKTATNVTKVDMYDVSKIWTGGVTWGASDGKHAWAAPGGEFGKYMPTPTSLTTAERGGTGPGWWNFSSPELTWLAQRWITKAVPNNGLLLKLSNEVPHVCCFERRVEWESSASTNKPYLAVQYNLPASADSKVSSPTDGTKTAKRFILTSAWDHSNVEGVKFQYRISKKLPPREVGRPEIPGTPWADIPTGQVLDQSNQNVSWPIGVDIDDRSTEPLYWSAREVVGTTTPKSNIQVRAILSGAPGASGYTKPVEVEVDKVIGGTKDTTAPVGPGLVDLLTGNFTVSRGDVSIPGFNSSLSFSRSFSSAEANVNLTGVLGPGWQPSSPVEMSNAAGWQKLILESNTEEISEGETETFEWASLKPGRGGAELRFDEDESGKFETPPEVSGTVLYRLNANEIAFTDPGGNRTIFSNNGSGNEYLPKSISQTGGEGNQSRLIYEIVSEKRRLKQVVSAAAPNISCTDIRTDGCRVLEFLYAPASSWGAPATAGDRLAEIRFRAFSEVVGVATYGYDSNGRLNAAWDPRISPNLKETYAYAASGQLATLAPPGLEPWTFQYETPSEDPSDTRLTAVKRASLVASKPITQTTIVYGVPVSGSGAPYDMSPQEVAKWGQEDLPTDAVAIFPPDEVPANPPSSYAHATVFYMDAEGQESNIATPAGAGTSAPSITTTETDVFSNVSRELTAENRLLSLAAGPGSVAKSEELDTQYHYSADGSKLLDERGPMHNVRLESGPEAGAIVQARSYVSTQYDVGAPEPKAGETWPELPTHQTSGALVGGKVLDQRTVQNGYNWTLRQQTEKIVDPEGLKITTITAYDKDTGLVTETRQPKDATTAGAGTMKYIYYKKAGATPGQCENDRYAGLLCRVEPVVQPGTSGQPQMPIQIVVSYNQLSEPIESIESTPGGESRKTVTSYDAAGRQLTKEVTGGGVPISKVQMEYAGGSGLPVAQRIVCPPSEPSCDRQSSVVTYDALGRVRTYKDADENTSETTYDFQGRPATFSDGKGTQTFRYDSASGLEVELQDSAAGVFTAAYNADGQIIQQGLPNGITESTAFDAAGAPSALTYTKASNCGASCTWLFFAVDRSARGQILSETGTLGNDEFAYDGAGRLTTARETPTGGLCTTRNYKFDENSNRTEINTVPGVAGICSSAGGSSQKYSYDTADRLLSEGLTYDDFGRIKNLPASLAGGKALATTYFSNDMVATQSQNGVTNSYQLDALLRPRQRLQAGGLQGTEIFHYAGSGDSPSWTMRGSTWTRNIVGIGGELAAIQESGKEVELQLTNLHGDVSATAALSSTVTALLSKRSYDEFGNQTSGTSGSRFGWLGGAQRRTELASGVIQMGARSYVPQIGRFTSRDPSQGGSATAYDYANQDPVNSRDPTGLKPYDFKESGPCKGHLHVWSNDIVGRDGYGKFQVRYGIECKATGYNVRVTKIIRRFENISKGQLLERSVTQPTHPGSPHYNGFWGNWFDGPAIKFDCLDEQEYEYSYELTYEYASPAGVVCTAKDCLAESGGGSLPLHAQEHCGHGKY
jgi:RHS repeat-associated protein